MSPVTLSHIFAALALVVTPLVNAQASGTSPDPPRATYPAVCLVQKGPFAYPAGIPYQIDTDAQLIRGAQFGYNICNGTTENQNSGCQTAWLNGLDDFCVWAPHAPGEELGNVEGSTVAWCSKPGHGTRLFPQGALKAARYIKTPNYVQVIGLVDQTQINMAAGDWGGEMDSGGADCRGNPIGAALISTAFSADKRPEHIIRWHNFMGGNRFCMKLCQGENAEHYCEHIYDRIGIDYNCPNDPVVEGVFESCEGESQDYPGTYVENGATRTYTQPAGEITAIPYTARIPASSNCRTFASTAIFTGLPAPTGIPTTSAATTMNTATSNSPPRVTGASTPNTPNSNTTNGTTPASGAVGFKASGIAILSAVALAVAYVA